MSDILRPDPTETCLSAGVPFLPAGPLFSEGVGGAAFSTRPGASSRRQRLGPPNVNPPARAKPRSDATTDATSSLIQPAGNSNPRRAACSRTSAPGAASSWLLRVLSVLCVAAGAACTWLVLDVSPGVPGALVEAGGVGAAPGWAGAAPAAVRRASSSSWPAKPPFVSPPSLWPSTFAPGAAGRGSSLPGSAAVSLTHRVTWRRRSGSMSAAFVFSRSSSSASATLTRRCLRFSTASRCGFVASCDVRWPARLLRMSRAKSRTLLSGMSNGSSFSPFHSSSPAAASATTTRAGLTPRSS